MTEKVRHVVTRAIILVERKILLGKRVRNGGVGQYALVGGRPEEGETPEKTIVREVNEELGIQLKNVKPWKREIDKKSDIGEYWTVYYFYGDGEMPRDLKKDEVSDIALVSQEDYKNYDIAFDHKKILEEFFEKAAS